MSGEAITYSSSSRRLSSTPRKSQDSEKLPRPRSLDLDSTGGSTYSLLSPIYHASYESDSDDQEESYQDLLYVTRAEPRSTSISLSAWEEWVISKAKEERLRMERRADEEKKKKEAEVQQQRERERRMIVTEERTRQWLKLKTEQEKLEKRLKESQELKEWSIKEQKKAETKEKAQRKYREWLEKKKQEDLKRKQKEQEEAAIKEAEARERKQKAEEKFRDWLLSAKDRPRSAPNVFGYSNGKLSGNSAFYPTPSYCNPIPWKPIHNPPQEGQQKMHLHSKNNKPVLPAFYLQSPPAAFKPKDNLTVNSQVTVSMRHRR